MMATLSTTNANITPTLSQITLSYAEQSPAPTVSLTVSPNTVTSGQSATLNWTSQNASTCTASGGWSGSKSTSGSASTGALSQTTAFNIVCTGNGGSANSTVTVTAQAAGGGSGGTGGGTTSYSCVTSVIDGHCPFPSDSDIVGANSDPYVDQNIWNGGGGYQQTLHANSPEDWYITANANTNFGGVLTYPNTGFDMTGAVDSFKSITSSWNVTIPTDSSKTAGWAAYDLWFNNWADEVMIQTDITANSFYQCDGVATITVSGIPWHMCDFGSERVWKPGTDDNDLVNRTVGSVDIKAFLTWMEQNGKLPARSTWTAGSFGFEVCDTEGVTDTFKVNGFTWNAQ